MLAAVVTVAAMSKMSTKGEGRQRRERGTAREGDEEARMNTNDGSATTMS